MEVRIIVESVLSFYLHVGLRDRVQIARFHGSSLSAELSHWHSFYLKKDLFVSSMVTYTFNPSPWEAKASGSL